MGKSMRWVNKVACRDHGVVAKYFHLWAEHPAATPGVSVIVHRRRVGVLLGPVTWTRHDYCRLSSGSTNGMVGIMAPTSIGAA